MVTCMALAVHSTGGTYIPLDLADQILSLLLLPLHDHLQSLPGLDRRHTRTSFGEGLDPPWYRLNSLGEVETH